MEFHVLHNFVDGVTETFDVSQIDPGVPIVYAGFGALMLTTCISFLSHSQVKILSTDALDMLVVLIMLIHVKIDNFFSDCKGMGLSKWHGGRCWRKV